MSYESAWLASKVIGSTASLGAMWNAHLTISLKQRLPMFKLRSESCSMMTKPLVSFTPKDRRADIWQTSSFLPAIENLDASRR